MLLDAKQNSGKPIGKNRQGKYLIVVNALQKLAGKEELDDVLKSLAKMHKLGDAIENSAYSINYKKDLKIGLKSIWKVSNGYD